MYQPAVVRSDAPERARRRTLSVGVGVIAVALAGALGVASLVGLSGSPATIPRLTFENPTDYALDVDVSPGPGGGWTAAGSVAQKSTAVVEEVVDQGDVWLFRFDSQGRSGGELRLTRAQLEDSGWLIAVPPEVGKRLAESGAPRSP